MRRIVVLEMEGRDSNALHVRYALWANVPAARQTFWQQRQNGGSQSGTFTSAVLDGSVTAAELAALQAGQVVEKVGESEWPQGTTLAQAQTFLQQAATTWQTFVNNYNPWAHYGSFFDDATNLWSMKVVA